MFEGINKYYAIAIILMLTPIFYFKIVGLVTIIWAIKEEYFR